MSERSQWIARLMDDVEARGAYIRAKLDVLLPAQVHALRLRHDWKQKDLASQADMKQSRISAMETPGAVNFNLETLVRLAATFRVGLVVKFVPVSEMLRWENRFNQDSFDVTALERDVDFLRPRVAASWPHSETTQQFSLFLSGEYKSTETTATQTENHLAPMIRERQADATTARVQVGD